MRKAIVLLTFCSLLHCQLMGGTAAGDDTIISRQINALVEKYVEYFSLSDLNGNYHFSFEKRFRDLFVSEAQIFNYLPQTTTYQQPISIDQYVNLVRIEMQDRILRPGAFEYYEVSRNYNPESGIVFIDLVLAKMVRIYSKHNYEQFFEIDILLQFNLIWDREQNTILIRSVSRKLPDIVDLEFRVFYADRTQARFSEVHFVYFDELLEQELWRKRKTNADGILTLSNVPENVVLAMYAGPGQRVLLENRWSASHWFNANEYQRFIVIEPEASTGRSFRKNSLNFRVNYDFPMFLMKIGNVRHYPHENPKVNMQPARGYSLDFRRALWRQNQFSLNAGIGLASSQLNVDVDARRLFSHPSGLMRRGNSSGGDTLFSRIIRETYTKEETRIPFLLSVSFAPLNRIFGEVDLIFRGGYSLTHDIDYSLFLEQDLEADVAPHFSLSQVSLVGDFQSRNPFAFSVELDFGFNLYKQILFLRYNLLYRFSTLGDQQRDLGYWQIADDHDNFFVPMLQRNELEFVNFSVGAGFTIKF